MESQQRNARDQGGNLVMEENGRQKKSENAGRPESTDQITELTPIDYMRIVNLHLMKNNQRDAYAVLKLAVVMYPDDPHILSYFGSLQAVVDKKYRTGIENCTKAIILFKKKSSVTRKLEHYAIFYLNLGRAYLAGKKKKDAIGALHKGLQYDNNNSAIMKQLQELGTRKKPPLPFLDRSNPINKFLGIMRHQEKKKSAGVTIKKRGQK